MDYQIIDNTLNEKDFNNIQSTIMGSKFPWFYSDHVANIYDNDSYYLHNFFDVREKYPCYQSYELIIPILQIIKAKALIRVKANMYPRTDKITEHNPHADFTFEHLGAIFYINTNNGYTVLEDGTKIKSIRNRLLLFNSSKQHYSTTCTDEKVRVNINFNYF